MTKEYVKLPGAEQFVIVHTIAVTGSASNTQSSLLALASDNAADKLDSSQILGQHSTP